MHGADIPSGSSWSRSGSAGLSPSPGAAPAARSDPALLIRPGGVGTEEGEAGAAWSGGRGGLGGAGAGAALRRAGTGVLRGCGASPPARQGALRSPFLHARGRAALTRRRRRGQARARHLRSPRPAHFLLWRATALLPAPARHWHSPISLWQQRDCARNPGGTPITNQRKQEWQCRAQPQSPSWSSSSRLRRSQSSSQLKSRILPAEGEAAPPGTPGGHRRDPDAALRGRILGSAPSQHLGLRTVLRATIRPHPGLRYTALRGAAADPPEFLGGAGPAQWHLWLSSSEQGLSRQDWRINTKQQPLCLAGAWSIPV
ncbi:uncharacterized protein LOC107204198 [Parus major]|uniref:uncharacterized protein LOC107204198 n=1 Tax=Parus major TaxID=9157 RepID=UPI0014440E97|nr:uncharacterized protein LOC107204198 [Parus major]